MHNPNPNVFRDDGYGNLELIPTNDPAKVKNLSLIRRINKQAGYRSKTYKPTVNIDTNGFKCFEIKPSVKTNADVDRIVVTKIHHRVKVQCMRGDNELWSTLLGGDHIKLLMSAFRGISKTGIMDEN